MDSQEQSPIYEPTIHYFTSSEDEEDDTLPPSPTSEQSEEENIRSAENIVDFVDLTCDSAEGENEELNNDNDSEELPELGDLGTLASSNHEYLQAFTTLELPSPSSSTGNNLSNESEGRSDEDDTLEEIRLVKEAAGKMFSRIENLEKKLKEKGKKKSSRRDESRETVQPPTPVTPPSNLQRVPDNQPQAGCSRNMTYMTSSERESLSRGNEGIQIARVPPTPTTPRQSPEGRRLVESEKEGNELKRKLAFLTMELAESRKAQVKKARVAAVRENVTIDVPEYPMEFYTQVNVNAITHPGNAEGWFRAFNASPQVSMWQSDDYHEWIASRINDQLPNVLQTVFNVWETTPSNKLTATDLLNCRRVSKLWKRSVDKFLQETSAEDSSKSSSIVSTVFCSGSSKIVGLEETLTRDIPLWSGQQHPFPSRELVVKNFYGEWVNANAEVFKNAISGLLALYGKNVHSFSYIDHYQASSEYEFPHLLLLKRWLDLRKWLEKMTNLKTLKLTFTYPPCADKSNSLFVHHQFPRLDQLRAIECKGVPKALLEAMLDANPQILKVNIINPIPGDRDVQWEDYKDCISVSHFTLKILNVGHLKPLQIVSWPLTKISISSGNLVEGLNLGGLFQTLETFGGTLTQLSLKLWALSSTADKFLRLKLPHLKNFSCCLRDSSFEENISYDFLLSLAALETLEISLEPEIERSRPVHQVIQLKGFVDRLYESNIWEVLPSLGRVVATSYCEDDGTPIQFKY